ncbi:DoxX-like family protein [Halalkalibacter sp. AB-rgal2]|uniref:DoxX-like family protein n=1 Tax=Halalkalibacter sp. AB-rgal2 TaxID=3242695 RepID=UPI00359EF2DE
MSKSKPIYVETLINTEMEKLWDYTQKPDVHQQWDLRFTNITYLPKENEGDPQHFLYQTNIGCGLTINGTGESVKTVMKKNERVSSLKFWANHPLSLIVEGSGYWKYTQTSDGIVFLTQYDYATRFGYLGKLMNVVFKPLMGWATAWSFDCLRLWLEKGISPQMSMMRSLFHIIASFVLAFIWIYQGLVPKVLFQDAGELELLQGTGLFQGQEELFLYILGVLQIGFGLSFLWLGRYWWLHVINIVALICLGVGALTSSAYLLAAPFNPLTLTMAMIGYSILMILNLKDLPSADHCKRKRDRSR